MLDVVFGVVAWGLLAVFFGYVVFGAIVAITTLTRFYIQQFRSARTHHTASKPDNRVPAE